MRSLEAGVPEGRGHGSRNVDNPFKLQYGGNKAPPPKTSEKYIPMDPL